MPERKRERKRRASLPPEKKEANMDRSSSTSSERRKKEVNTISYPPNAEKRKKGKKKDLVSHKTAEKGGVVKMRYFRKKEGVGALRARPFKGTQGVLLLLCRGGGEGKETSNVALVHVNGKEQLADSQEKKDKSI